MGSGSVGGYLDSLARELELSLEEIKIPKSGSIYFKVEGAGHQSHVVVKEGGFFTWLASKIWPAQYDLNRVSRILTRQLSLEPPPKQDVSDLFRQLLKTASAQGKLGNQKTIEEVNRLIQTVRKKQTPSTLQRILGIESDKISKENVNEVRNTTALLLLELNKIKEIRDYGVPGSLAYGVYNKIVGSIQKQLDALPDKGDVFISLLTEAECLLNSHGIETPGQKAISRSQIKKEQLAEIGRPGRLLLELRSLVRKAEIVGHKKFPELLHKIERAFQHPTKDKVELLQKEIFGKMHAVEAWPEQLKEFDGLPVLPLALLETEFTKHLKESR